MFTLIDKIRNFFCPSAELSRIESIVFDAVKVNLRASDSELLDRQLKAINRVHRSPDSREVNLFVIRKGESAFPPELCFRNKSEFKIAVVDINATNGATLRARVWCVNGHVFSIEYKTSPSEFEETAAGEWRIECHIENCPS